MIRGWVLSSLAIFLQLAAEELATKNGWAEWSGLAKTSLSISLAIRTPEIVEISLPDVVQLFNIKFTPALIHEINEVTFQPGEADMLALLERLVFSSFNASIIHGYNIMPHVHKILVWELDKNGYSCDAITIQNEPSWWIWREVQKISEEAVENPLLENHH